MKKAVVVVLFVAAFFTACNKGTPASPPIAMVNADPILASSFIVRFSRAKQSLDKLSHADAKTIGELKRRVLNKMVLERLIEQEAEKKQIVITDEELDR